MAPPRGGGAPAAPAPAMPPPQPPPPPPAGGKRRAVRVSDDGDAGGTAGPKKLPARASPQDARTSDRAMHDKEIEINNLKKTLEDVKAGLRRKHALELAEVERLHAVQVNELAEELACAKMLLERTEAEKQSLVELGEEHRRRRDEHVAREVERARWVMGRDEAMEESPRDF